MNTDLLVHYEAVLGAERAERERLCDDIKRLNAQLKLKDNMIAALVASLAADQADAHGLAKPLPFPQPVGLGTVPQAPVPDSMVYAGISVRWGILSLMSDHAAGTMSTPDMAEALIAGGVRSGGQNFTANVSAVVSDMVKNRQELELIDGKYRITPHGKDVWTTIKVSRRYRNRRYGWGPQNSAAEA
jgi:hypothetical protein